MQIRLQSFALACAATLVVAASAHGLELKYGARGEVIWNDNVFFQADDQTKDWSLRGTPFFELADDRGDVQWDFRYSPAYEYYLDRRALSGWDHSVDASATWRPTQRFSISVREVFGRFNSIARLTDETSIDPEDGTVALETFDALRRFWRNTLSISGQYVLSNRDVLSFGGSWTVWDFSQETRRDLESTSVQAQYLRAINQLLQLGFSASWRTQEFDSTPTIMRQDKTDYYNVSIDLVYQMNPTGSIRFSAGPTLVDAPPIVAGGQVRAVRPVLPVFDDDGNLVDGAFIDAESCPVVDGFFVESPECSPTDPVADTLNSRLAFGADGAAPPALQLFPEPLLVAQVPVVAGIPDDSLRTTYFADIAITQSWENWDFQLSYRRQDDQSSGLQAASVADIVFGQVRYRPSQRWVFTLSATWVQREQEQEILFFPFTALENTAFFVNRESPAFNFLNTVDVPVAAQSIGVIADTVDATVRLETIRASFEARRRVTENLTFTARFIYSQDKSTGTFTVSRETDRISLRFGVLYEFDPVRFNGI